MRIIKKATVKHILTPALQEKMLKDFEDEEHRLEKEREQLRFQMQKKLKREDVSHRKNEIRERFEKELTKRQEKTNQVLFQRSQLEQLNLGQEITSGQVESLKEIRVGDDWPLKEQEIIVEDGKIIAIRNKDG